MGHLMTVQNLMLALGLSPNLEREDFPAQGSVSVRVSLRTAVAAFVGKVHGGRGPARCERH